MAFWTAIIFGFLGFVGLIAFIIYMAYQTKQERKIKVRPNSPLIEIESSLRRSLCDSYKKGIVKNQLKRPNGTTFIEFYAFDVEQGIDIARPDLKWIVVKDEYIKRNAEGRRVEITILPLNKLDMPQEKRDTLEGKYLEGESLKAFVISQIGKSIKVGDEAISEIMQNLSRTGLTKYQMESIREYVKEIVKMNNINNQENNPENKPKE